MRGWHLAVEQARQRSTTAAGLTTDLPPPLASGRDLGQQHARQGLGLHAAVGADGQINPALEYVDGRGGSHKAERLFAKSRDVLNLAGGLLVGGESLRLRIETLLVGRLA